MGEGKPPLAAFTVNYHRISHILSSQIYIAEPFDPKDLTVKQNWLEYVCIWDTGATGSVISPKVVSDLKLLPTGKTICNTAGGQVEQNTFLVNIKLPNNVKFQAVRVTEAPIIGSDALIGMDIISKGDLAVTNKNGITIMSYQWPSGDEIDFVAEINRKKLVPSHSNLSDDEKRKARNRRKKESKKRK